MPNASFGLDQYSSEQADIERRRAYAMALQQQGLAPMGGTEMAGGWAIKRSPMEGIGKVLQAYAGARGQEKATEEQRALGERYQSDLARTMMQAQSAGAGTPAMASQMYEDAAGNAAPTDARAAVAPDRAAMARILMGHPETRPLALQQMQQDMQRQGFMAAGGMAAPQGGAGATQGAPAMAGQGGPQGTPQGAPGGFGGPAGGQPMAVWLQLDPTGKAYTEQLAKDHTERGKPVVNRGYGIGTMNAQGQYVADPASVAQARQVEEMKAGIHAGYAPPVSVPMSGGQSASIFPPEFAGVRQTGQPPARLGGQAAPAPIPQAPLQAPGAPRTPAHAAFNRIQPPESPAQNSAAMGLRLRTLQSELAQEQAKVADPRTPAQDREVSTQNVAAITREIAGTPGGRAAGPGTIGLTQPQDEQIRQKGQEAANTEAGKEFISEMRQNYAKLRDVPATLQNIERARGLAASEAKNFMGPFGESRLAVTKFMRANVPGMGNLKTEGVTNAEELQSTLFNQVMDNLKKMDASPSQYQQQVMQEAFGTLRTDAQSVPKILSVFEDILRNRVSLHNETVTSAEGRGTTFPYEVKVKLPDPRTTGPLPKTPANPNAGGLNEQEKRELQALRSRFGR